MSLLDSVCVPRRTMTLFFLIDKSGSMSGQKIGAVNDAVVNVLPMLDDITANNPDAEIKIAALEFSTNASWLYSEPKLACDFAWRDVLAGGLTSLGEAFSQLESKLHQNGGFMGSGSGSYAPAIILLSDGGPTDDYQVGLTKLQQNNWFKSAIKVAIAIGNDANKNILAEFAGNPEGVFEVHNIDALKQIIRIVAVTSSQIGSKSSSAGDATKNDQVIAEVAKQIDNVDGASQTAAKPSTSVSYDDWA